MADRSEETWKSLLENNVAAGIRLWPEMFERLHSKIDLLEDDPSYYEKLCHAIIDAIQRLDEAWTSGQFTSHLLPCQQGEDIMHFAMNRNQLVVREQANGIIRVWNRHTLQLEAELMGVASGKVQNFGLHENIVVCGGSDGTIQVWDIEERVLAKTLWQLEGRNIFALNCGPGLVVAWSCTTNVLDGKFTFWRVPNNLTGIWMDSEIGESFICHNMIFMDKKFIVLPLVTPTLSFHFKVRSTQTPYEEISSCIRLPVDDVRQCQYQNGHLVIGSTNGTIRIIDIETGICKQMIATGFNFIDRSHILGVNARYIAVSCLKRYDHDAAVILWDWDSATNSKEQLLKPVATFKAFSDHIGYFKMDEFEIVAVKGMTMPEEPVRYAFSFEIISFFLRCATCHLVSKRLMQCSRCKSADYCSTQCQRADWKRHRILCTILAAEEATVFPN